MTEIVYQFLLLTIRQGARKSFVYLILFLGVASIILTLSEKVWDINHFGLSHSYEGFNPGLLKILHSTLSTSRSEFLITEAAFSRL